MSPKQQEVLPLGLKDFQRRTVDHVSRRMLDQGARRFLVADEVGLGKTLVARGVIANTVERLRAEGVRRIDVIYVCSNQEIAKQNLDRLRLPGHEEGTRLSRIGLLPEKLDELDSDGLNFVSLTPGTSLDPKSSTGWARERAILLEMLREPWGFSLRKSVLRIFRVDAGWDTMKYHLHDLDRLHEGLCQEFAAAMRNSPLRETFEDLRALRRELNDEERQRRNELIAGLRRELARICVVQLEPDLVVMDEFQRFGHLLDGESDDAILARYLFNFDNGRGEFARVLLLSATPYKAYTHAQEVGASHQSELLRLLRFLSENDAASDEIEHGLRRMRELLLTPGTTQADLLSARHALEHRLSQVMVRTERLACSATRNGMLVEPPAPALQLEADDVEQYLTLSRLHDLLRDHGYLDSGSALTEYWKSAPWLAQFMDGYAMKKAIRDALNSDLNGAPELSSALKDAAKTLPWVAFRDYEVLTPANSRMRSLAADTAEQTWDLLWMPPALPYYAAGAPFDRPGVERATKRLVFSAWNVVPRAIAGYLSYEAERRAQRALNPQATNRFRTAHERRPLEFGVEHVEGEESRLRGMPVVAWMYPSRVLADIVDPRALAAAAVGPANALAVVRETAARLESTVRRLVDGSPVEGTVDQRWYWAAPILLDAEAEAAHAFWAEPQLAKTWGDQRAKAANWPRHVEQATEVYQEELSLGRAPEDLPEVLALLALAGPGVTALRGLGRVLPDLESAGSQLAAARIAWGMRHVFNAPEATAIVMALHESVPYWRGCLQYALAGNLQAVLDEWLHIAAEDAGAGQEADEDVCPKLIERITAALELGASRVEVDRLDGRDRVNWRTHFAIRYGQFKEDGRDESFHPEAVRRAFNSPFRPFVLASTSVGQEGLDFHTYCHAIVHWNIPSNPIDLEQREGRVHRYKGHAIRRNVAAAHRAEALTSEQLDPWKAAFDAAATARDEGEDELVPYWLHPGDSAIERYVPVLPFSKDKERRRSVLERVTLYRMVFGQPRQDDLISYLRDHMGQDEAERLAELVRIDLSPSGV